MMHIQETKMKPGKSNTVSCYLHCHPSQVAAMK